MTYRVRNVSIAIALALVAALLTLFYVTNYRRSVQQSQATVHVFVAAHNIAAGVSGSDLARKHAFQSVSVARRNVVPGAISDPSQVARLVVSQPIYAGEQVTLRRFSDIQTEGIAGRLTGTMRAVQVPGDTYQLLVGTLHEGDHVDMVGNFRIDSQTDVRETRIVLRDLTVLQIPAASTTPTTAQTSSVMLAVTDTQVQRLFWLLKNGDWTLELRPTRDGQDSPERIDGMPSILAGGIR